MTRTVDEAHAWIATELLAEGMRPTRLGQGALGGIRIHGVRDDGRRDHLDFVELAADVADAITLTGIIGTMTALDAATSRSAA